MVGQKGFWHFEERLAELSAEGDPLVKLSATVDFEVFRPILRRALRQAGPSRMGRPPFCPVLKFRMLVLQSLLKTFKRNYVYINYLPNAKIVLEIIAEWLEEYNESHPHSGLKMRSPREFRSA